MSSDVTHTVPLSIPPDDVLVPIPPDGAVPLMVPDEELLPVAPELKPVVPLLVAPLLLAVPLLLVTPLLVERPPLPVALPLVLPVPLSPLLPDPLPPVVPPGLVVELEQLATRNKVVGRRGMARVSRQDMCVPDRLFMVGTLFHRGAGRELCG
jgi:hypothetical protein